MRPRLPLLAALAAALAACADEPTGPHRVLVTAHGVAPDAVLAALDPAAWPAIERPAATGDPRADAGALLSDRPAEELAQLPPGRALPGEVETLAESLSVLGFENAAFVTAPELGEDSGLLQGFLHASDRPLLEALDAADPLNLAAESARGYLAWKLPRPAEDAAFVWLHLDVRGLPEADAVERVTDAARALREALADAPRAPLLLAVLPAEPGATALLAGNAAYADRAADLAEARGGIDLDDPFGLEQADPLGLEPLPPLLGE